MKTITFSLKRAKVIAIALFFQTLLVAAPIRNYPTTITQPDGQLIHCFVSGDEFYHWLHDANNYTIVYDRDNGWYTYASIANGTLVPTNYFVGKVVPSKVGLIPGIKPSDIFIQNLRNQRMTHLKNQTSFNASTISGTLNKISIFVRFSDEEEYLDSFTIYQKIYNDTSQNAKSIYNFYHEASYGKFFAKTYFLPTQENGVVISYKDIHTRGYYKAKSTTNPDGYPNIFDTIAARQNELVKNSINYVKVMIPDSINLDMDNNNEIDNIGLILSGDIDNIDGIFWPWTYSYIEYANDTIWVNNKRVNWVDATVQNRTLAGFYGEIAHEIFHTLGSPDLYHYYDSNKELVGEWDLMGSHARMQHMSAYMKYRYGGWIDSIPLISVSGTYSLKSLVSDKNNCYRINSPYSTTQYFVLEYRQKLGTFDVVLPGSGLLVYRVNTLADGQGNAEYPKWPNELYLFRPNGSPTAIGNVSLANLNETRNSINDTTETRCFLANGDPGGLNISNIREQGDSIVFYVNMEPVNVLQSVLVNNNLELFPNPTNGSFQFNYPENISHSGSIQIFDYLGHPIKTQTVSSIKQDETVTIDLSKQPTGIYLVRLKTGKEEFSGKVLLVK